MCPTFLSSLWPASRASLIVSNAFLCQFNMEITSMLTFSAARASCAGSRAVGIANVGKQLALPCHHCTGKTLTLPFGPVSFSCVFSVPQEAGQYLSMPNENLTTRIGEALANTPFENYQIHPLSATDQVNIKGVSKREDGMFDAPRDLVPDHAAPPHERSCQLRHSEQPECLSVPKPVEQYELSLSESEQ
jgi:hypothetical protein